MRSSGADVRNAWASAVLGIFVFLIVGLLPRAPMSLALGGQLLWLALVGSLPVAAVLLVADRTAGTGRGVMLATSAAVALLTVALGWAHTDFLLSGPRWAVDPARGAARAAITTAFGVAGAAGWCWLVLGARARGLGLGAWVVASALAIAASTALMVRYRAYDHSMAQVVFPSATLGAAVVHNLVRGSKRRARIAVALGVVGLALGAGSRLSADLEARGQREAIAQSRAGALTMLYVLPRWGTDPQRDANGRACSSAKPEVLTASLAMAPESRRNVIIVTVDALRRDVVGAEARGKPVTPSLVRLGERGVVFTNATSPYPATLFAIGSAFTGLTPAELYTHPSLPETIFTRSRGFVDRQLAVLPDVSWFRLPIVGEFLAGGVETTFAKTDADATSRMLGMLGAARDEGSSVVAWIHYYAPHDPYETRPGFDFGTGKKNAYLSEVAHFDRELGRLVDTLDRRGWLEDTLVVFFSDHGEGLGERAYFGHHVYLDGWMVDVPLVLWHADLEPSTRTTGVSLADVAPTVLHFLGLPTPSDLPASSLFMLPPDLDGRPTFSEAFPVRGRELFDGFRLPSLDDATIARRLRSIRTVNRGYEPKVAITEDRHRLIRHRAMGVELFYERDASGRQTPARSTESIRARGALEAELDDWEAEQLHRIGCRLKLKAPPTPRPK